MHRVVPLSHGQCSPNLPRAHGGAPPAPSPGTAVNIHGPIPGVTLRDPPSLTLRLPACQLQTGEGQAWVGRVLTAPPPGIKQNRVTAPRASWVCRSRASRDMNLLRKQTNPLDMDAPALHPDLSSSQNTWREMSWRREEQGAHTTRSRGRGGLQLLSGQWPRHRTFPGDKGDPNSNIAPRQPCPPPVFPDSFSPQRFILSRS